MTGDTLKQRQRAKKPKVRTGCRTCKSRRVKCDEDRPSCKRCQTAGRICEGYEISFSVRRNHSPHAIAIAPKLVVPSTVSLGLTHDESTNFDYFRTRTMPSIGGFSRYNSWEALIMQLTVREPSILNAAVAVGSMHRSFERHRWHQTGIDDIAVQKSLSQKHYFRAINSLQSKLADTGDPRRHEIALLTCFLFICLELIQSDTSSAKDHLRTGLNILCELKGRSKKGDSMIVSASSHPESLLDFLTIFFARLDYQSTMFGEKVPRTIALPSSNTTGSLLWVPQAFSNVTEARQYLDTVSSAVFAFRGRIVNDLASPNSWQSNDKSLKHRWAHIMYKLPDVKMLDPKLPAQQAELEDRMLAWEKTFQKLVAKNQRFFSQEDSRASKLAHNNWLAIWILLKEALSTQQKSFDHYRAEFKQIVALSEEFCSVNDSALPSFSTDMGCFGALYYVAIKCRDSAIRNKAASLLLQSPRREGMWDGHVISQFARQVIDIEEAGLTPRGAFLTSDEVPESSRISDITIGFSKDGSRGRLYLGRFKHETDGHWFVREMEFDFNKDPTSIKDTSTIRHATTYHLGETDTSRLTASFGLWPTQFTSPTGSYTTSPRNSISVPNQSPFPSEIELEYLRRGSGQSVSYNLGTEPKTPSPTMDISFTTSVVEPAVWHEAPIQDFSGAFEFGALTTLPEVSFDILGGYPAFEFSRDTVLDYRRSGSLSVE